MIRRDAPQTSPPPVGALTPGAPGAPAVLAPPTAADPVLEALDLVKTFAAPGARRLARPAPIPSVDHVSLALRAGTITALVGESGSGKSTVVRLLAGRHRPTSGVIKLHGHAPNLRARRTRRRYATNVQMIFQDPYASLNPVHTVGYHLERAARLHPDASAGSSVAARVDEILEKVSLVPASAFLRKLPHQMSGGQRQRVAIARTLIVGPEVLLADEPISMLDMSIRLDILDLLARLTADEHLAMLFVTHDIASARYIAQEMLVMYRGQIVEAGPSEAVTQAPKHPYTELLISAAPDPRRASRPPEVRTTDDTLAPELAAAVGCRFAARCPAAMPICTSASPPVTTVGTGHWSRCWLHAHTADQPAPGHPTESTVSEGGTGS